MPTIARVLEEFPELQHLQLEAKPIDAGSRALMAESAQPGPPLRHALMQMRARVLMDDSVQGLQRLRGETSSPELGDQLAALYGGALAASLRREHARAEARERWNNASMEEPRRKSQVSKASI